MLIKFKRPCEKAKKDFRKLKIHLLIHSSQLTIYSALEMRVSCWEELVGLMGGKTGTVRQMTVRSWMDDITEDLFQPFVTGEVKCVGWPRPYSCNIQTPDWPPDSLRPHDSPQSVHHVTVAGSWLWLKALHARLQQRTID